MNPYKFINSESLAKYLEEIQYPFDSFDCAYLVYHSKKVTFFDRLQAIEEIINTMPDCELQSKVDNISGSLHEYLKRIAKVWRVCCFEINHMTPAIYSFKIIYTDPIKSDEQTFNSTETYPDSIVCMGAMHKAVKEFDKGEIKRVIMRKEEPDITFLETTDKDGTILDEEFEGEEETRAQIDLFDKIKLSKDLHIDF